MNQTIHYEADRSDYAWSFFVHNASDRTAYLTSDRCSEHLTQFMQRPALLAVASEASSHVSGLESLYAQPWLWAGGGLGNIDECPLQTCLAGTSLHSSLIFASVCVVPECHATDVAAADFPAVVDRAAQAASDQLLAKQYADGIRRMHIVNKFLGTGWTCGELIVPFQPWPWGIPYLAIVTILLSAVVYATCGRGKRQRTTSGTSPNQESGRQSDQECKPLLHPSEQGLAALSRTGEKESMTPVTSASTLSFCWRSLTPSSSSSSLPDTSEAGSSYSSLSRASSSGAAFIDAFDVRTHWHKLFHSPSPTTAVLDGLRVGSMLWIILGHVMAIDSSTGAGYTNPAAFLPPNGITNTFLGQLLFSSRLAVDTFFVLSGFLTVHVVSHKLPLPTLNDGSNGYHHSPFRRYMIHFPGLLISRVVRIFPLYIMCLLFYTQVAPQLGSGPFWYQWLALLKPCHDTLWSNLLFVNNFWPPNQPVTSTCFYHSWYLAVDLQLFLVAVCLVFWHQSRPKCARITTLILWFSSVIGTAIGAGLRHWSVNSFDGAAVVRYDTEAYAKPWIRSVAYLTGMYVAMLLPRSKLATRSPWRRIHHWIMAMALFLMVAITLGTAFGAYSRRACRTQDWPADDQCGSEWSSFLTWLYTSTSRSVWCLCLGTLLYICLGRPAAGNPVAALLSWSAWTPLSHLTFGAYLIHPVVIFIWQLGNHQKEDFRLATFGMNYVSVTMVSYVAALATALTVEFPAAALWKRCGSGSQSGTTIQKSSSSHLYGSV